MPILWITRANSICWLGYCLAYLPIVFAAEVYRIHYFLAVVGAMGLIVSLVALMLRKSLRSWQITVAILFFVLLGVYWFVVAETIHPELEFVAATQKRFETLFFSIRTKAASGDVLGSLSLVVTQIVGPLVQAVILVALFALRDSSSAVPSARR